MAELIETRVQDVPEIVDQARQDWRTHQVWSDGQKREFTLRQLNNFWRLIEENRQALCQALKDDLNKSECDATMGEINMVLADLMLLIRDYDDLAKPRPFEKNFLNKFNDIYTKPEPYGVALIIGAWNAPFLLICQPMVGAMAAGNAVVVKPSELSVHTSNLLATLIPKYLDQNYYKVITGGADVAQAVLKERFNYIFYTGSTNIGRIVMAEAAKTLTPVTLELGGKSPAIVTDDANLRIAAKRIMLGKLIITGQICIAPDYVLLTSPAMRDQFIEYCKAAITSFYGENPAQSSDYGKIINRKHFDRITKLMASSKGRNVLSGATDVSERYIAPAIFVDVGGDDALMQEEVFGPVLPVLTVNGIDEAVQYVNEGERPLALYVFTESKTTFEMVARSTSSGAIVHNCTVLQFGVPSLPFGGVGNSGMGAYHGKCTFETFSHMKPVFRTGTKLDFLMKFVYPPHSNDKIKQANFAQLPSMRKWSVTKPILLVVLMAFIGVLAQVYGVLSRWFY